MTIKEILPYASLMIAVISLFLSQKRTMSKDIASQTARETEAKITEDYLKTQLAEIKAMLQAGAAEDVTMRGRMAKNESSTKQAHHRIDRIDELLQGGGEK